MIIQNLLTNAIKYTPEEGYIVLDITKHYPDVLIKVTDNGFGIPSGQQDRIFSKLYRAENVVARNTEGTGLGLYIVKSILDHAGGRVWFDSEENKGTAFYVSLPLEGMKARSGTKSLS
jgi:two-component system sensor histidine kinase VicK